MKVDIDQHWPVWDRPVRLIHWYFPLAIVFMWWSAEEGYMRWHSWCGYSVLVMAATRITWGFVGSHYARFQQFLRQPSTVWRYVRGAGFDEVGHNPLGGYSVLLLLLLIMLQGVTGLVSADDILFEGPLAYWAGDWSPRLTQWHVINWTLLMLAMAVHLLAIAFYTLVKKQPLITAMWRGRASGRSAAMKPVSALWALLVALIWSVLLMVMIMFAPEAPTYY